MAGILYANDIGGIGSAMQADESLRQQAWQNAMATLMRQREQAQAQAQRKDEFDRSLKFSGQQALTSKEDRNVGNELRRGELMLREAERQDRNRLNAELLKQPSASSLKNILERLAAAKLEIGSGTFDPSNYADLQPEHLNPLTRIDAAQRQSDAEALSKANEVADAANFLKRYDRRMKEIKDSPGFMATGNWSKPETSPEAAQRVEALRRNLAPLLTDPMLKIVETDPTTGNYVPPSSLIKPWMTMGTNTPASVIGRQLNMNTAPAAAPPQASSAIPDSLLARQVQMQSRPLNIAMPPTATGTNMPPFVRQNGVVFRLMPNGSYQPVAP